WTDLELQTGEDWEPGIYRAIARADAAVVMVSPDFLASEFIRDKELPRLQEAREERGLNLMPLFLRHSTVHLLPEPLTRIEGLNDPGEPLADLSPSRQDEVLAAAAETIYRTLEAQKSRPAVPRRQVTAALELRGKHVARRYGQPPYYDLHASRGPIDLKRLQALAERSVEELGRQLFEILFGSEDDRNAVLSKAYQRQIPDPLRHAFRVRVRSDDAVLRELPWASCCRWRKHVLVDKGWTFELAASDQPRPIEHLHTPCRALLIAAEPKGLPRLAADAHGKGLESLLARAWSQPLKTTLLHRARTREEIEAELASPPDLIHVYAHARGGDAGIEILLDDGEGGIAPLAFDDLAALLKPRSPRVLVLNTVGECPLAPPLPGVAALLHLRHPLKNTDAAAHWWGDVLGLGRDPVRAFCDLPEDVRRRGALVTDYQEWKLEHSDYVPKVDRPRAHLDRRDQRRVVLEAVEELVKKPKRRVTCVVAYGAEGNLVEHFAVQMLATLKERAASLARLHHHKVDLPPERDELTRQHTLEHFREIFQLQPSQPLTAAFPSRRAGPRAKPVHFLDWGTYGKSHDPPLLSGHLETWVAFCRDDLEAACPTDARILSYLGLASDAARHAALEELVSALNRRYHQPHFDLVALPALGTVEADDLLRFFSDGNNSSCPEAFLADFPERIALETGGSFEATVELLEKTERGNRWWELDEELPKVEVKVEIDPEMEL
ncbi:MAG: toll/interleukin-1 receptor domain-containing protein, partial [Thermoanaerobaculia bacterium]